MNHVDSEPERVAERIRLHEESRARKYAIRRGDENIPRSSSLASRPETRSVAHTPEQSEPHGTIIPIGIHELYGRLT